MPIPIRKNSPAQSLNIISSVALASFVLGILYFGQDIIVPIALAILLTFLLAPLATRMERYIGRIAAVIVVVMVVLALTVSAAWIFTRQVVDLAAELPNYKENLVSKIHSMRGMDDHKFEKISVMIDDLKEELPGENAGDKTEPSKDDPKVRDSGDGDEVVTEPEQDPEEEPVPVKMVEESKASSVDLAQTMLGPLVGPLGTGALVIVLLIFMLVQREDLRNRMIRVVGQGRIGTTTHAMQDAGKRVSRYLLMQLIVNLTYGIVLAIGLHFIGVPNAILWGAFAAVLRFIPYIGPWLAAAMPILLSLAVSPGWTVPLLTIGLFVVLELLSNNVMEPWLYGSSTGVTSIALIIAAVFWTFLWGPVGLLLSTPLTVCMVVLGRHVPRLAFFSVLMSDQQALTPVEECYHRFLTPGPQDELEFVDIFLRTNSLNTLYDSVFVPVIRIAETDERQDLIEVDQLTHVRESIEELIDDLGKRESNPDQVSVAGEDLLAPAKLLLPSRVHVLPASSERDELAGKMLCQLLDFRGMETWIGPSAVMTGELVTMLGENLPDIVCISVLPPSTVLQARYLCKKLNTQYPTLKIVVGLWSAEEGLTAATRRLKDAGADLVVTTFADAVEAAVKLSPPAVEDYQPPPLPDDEEERLKALHALNLIGTADHPIFDRITTRLARIFDVSVVLLSLVDKDELYFKSQVGLPEDLARSRKIDRNISVCSHLVHDNKLLVVEDLARDRRFAANSWLRNHSIRFYAGAPIRTPDGQPIGTLCLLDHLPRTFSEQDRRQLAEFADDIMTEIAKLAAAALERGRVIDAI